AAEIQNGKGEPTFSPYRPRGITDKQGYFMMGVPEGKGHLVVWTASADHVVHSVSMTQLLTGKPELEDTRYIFGQTPIDVRTGAIQVEAQVSVDRGVTVEGQVVGADGTVPATLGMFYRGNFQNFTDAMHAGTWPLYNGHLKIRGVPREGELLVYLLDTERREG